MKKILLAGAGALALGLALSAPAKALDITNGAVNGGAVGNQGNIVAPLVSGQGAAAVNGATGAQASASLIVGGNTPIPNAVLNNSAATNTALNTGTVANIGTVSNPTVSGQGATVANSAAGAVASGSVVVR